MTQHHQLDEPKWHKEGAGANQCVCVSACVRPSEFAYIYTCVSERMCK